MGEGQGISFQKRQVKMFRCSIWSNSSLPPSTLLSFLAEYMYDFVVMARIFWRPETKQTLAYDLQFYNGLV